MWNLCLLEITCFGNMGMGSTRRTVWTMSTNTNGECTMKCLVYEPKTTSVTTSNQFDKPAPAASWNHTFSGRNNIYPAFVFPFGEFLKVGYLLLSKFLYTTFYLTLHITDLLKRSWPYVECFNKVFTNPTQELMPFARSAGGRIRLRRKKVKNDVKWTSCYLLHGRRK